MASNEKEMKDTGNQTPNAIAIIARCWWYPDAQLEEALDNGLFKEELSTTPTIDDLQKEYTRLFIGPGDHPCSPYESVYRDQGSSEGAVHVHGESTRSVVDWYRQYELMPDSTWKDLPDHIAVELEFAGHLRRNDPDALSAFMNEHPQQWMPEFLTAVENHTEMPYYSHLAATTKQLLISNG